MRYNRQLIYHKILEKGQQKLLNSSVAIIGLGAIGTNSAQILARSGVGKLIIIDRDFIELNNLQRQCLYNEYDIGRLKSKTAAEKLKKINSSIKIEFYSDDLDFENIGMIKSDIILDCTDNMHTRFLINEYAMKNKIPWIYSSVIKSEGMVFNIIPGRACFSCIFNNPTESLGTCDTEGIIGSAPSAIASIQATEAIKIITENKFEKKLIKYDIWNNNITKIKVHKNKKCKTCNNNYEYLNGMKEKPLIKLCGNEAYQIIVKHQNLKNIINKLKKIDSVENINDLIQFRNISITKNGRIIIKAKNEREAKIVYDKYIG